MGRITQREYACFQWDTLKPTALNSRATILLIPEDAPVTNATLLITKKGILVKKRRGVNYINTTFLQMKSHESIQHLFSPLHACNEQMEQSREFPFSLTRGYSSVNGWL